MGPHPAREAGHARGDPGRGGCVSQPVGECDVAGSTGDAVREIGGRDVYREQGPGGEYVPDAGVSDAVGREESEVCG